MNDNINTLCFSGGGTKGFSFVTAIKILIDNNYINLNNINKFVGSSIGSITAFLFSINYTPDELIIFLSNIDLSNIGNIFNLELFIEKYGFSDANEFIKIVEILFYNKMKMINVTFKDLYIITKNKLLIIGTNFTKGKEEVFSVDTTPTMLVLDAIRISISIPLLFTPIKHNNCYYVDGCILGNLPFHLCDPNTTLCLFFKSKCFKLNSTFDLINGVLSLLMNSTLKFIGNYKKLIIYNDECDTQVCCDKNNLKKLFNIGYKNGKRFLIKEYKKQINQLTDNIIENVLNDIVNNIIKQD
jgi:NTE family protein